MQNAVNIFEIREYRPETDKAFVMASTLNGIYYGCPRYQGFDKRMFMDHYKQILTKLLDSQGTQVMVACSKEDPDQIFGYSILSSDFLTIHWVFVKSIYRNGGIGKSLVPAFATAYTHATDVGNQLVTKLESKPAFNPFILGLI